MEVLKTPPHQSNKNLTRDERIRVHTLHNTGLGLAKIASQLNFLYHQVQYAATHRVTPQSKLSGNKSFLDSGSLQILIDFVCASRRNRRMPYYEVPGELGWSVSECIVQHALEKEGFRRHPARRKSVYSFIIKLY